MPLFSKAAKKILPSLGILFIFLLALFLSYSRLFDNYELETLDIRFALRPRIPIDENIVIIEIGDDTINKLEKWPLSRRYHATLIDILQEIGVKAVLFDVFFSEEQDEEADTKFSETLRNSDIVYLPYVFNLTEKRKLGFPVADRFQEPILEKFAEATKETGFINIIPDTDGKFRRIHPFIEHEGELYPHIGFLMSIHYLGFSQKDINVEPGRSIVLPDALKVPLDSDSSIIVNFAGRWKDTFRHYSYVDVIDSYISSKFPDITGREPIVDLATLKDSVCFIGSTATGAPDAHPSPYEALYPGVGMHASLFNSLVNNRFIQRPRRLSNIAILIFLFIGTYVITQHAARRLFGFVFNLLLMVGYILFAWALFAFWGIWVDIFYPVAAMLVFYLGITFVRYINEVHQREVLEKELAIAKNIQESFLPKKKPEISSVEIAAKMLTAKQVGGDLYDFVQIDDKKTGIMIGDVSGKGVPAALYMASVVSEFRSYTKDESPSQVILKLNERLCAESGSGLFVTLSYLIIDSTNNVLIYSTAGHLPIIAFVKDGRKTELLDLKEGMPLGLFEGTFGEEKTQFKKGDMFVLYTDGVTEAMNSKGEMFGTERLTDLVKNNNNLPSEAIVNLIHGEVKKFEGKGKQHDDITVIAIKVV